MLSLSAIFNFDLPSILDVVSRVDRFESQLIANCSNFLYCIVRLMYIFVSEVILFLFFLLVNRLNDYQIL